MKYQSSYHFVRVLSPFDKSEGMPTVYARLVVRGDGTLDMSRPSQVVTGYGRGFRAVAQFSSQRDALVASVNYGLFNKYQLWFKPPARWPNAEVNENVRQADIQRRKRH